MKRLKSWLWQTPDRLCPTYARFLIGLALFVLALAALGLLIYDGLQRVAYIGAIGSIALGNLAWGIGSHLPEEQGGRTAREVARPFFIVMMLSLPVAFALTLTNGS